VLLTNKLKIIPNEKREIKIKTETERENGIKTLEPTQNLKIQSEKIRPINAKETNIIQMNINFLCAFFIHIMSF
jgi:hypothetical protein